MTISSGDDQPPIDVSLHELRRRTAKHASDPELRHRFANALTEAVHATGYDFASADQLLEEVWLLAHHYPEDEQVRLGFAMSLSAVAMNGSADHDGTTALVSELIIVICNAGPNIGLDLVGDVTARFIRTLLSESDGGPIELMDCLTELSELIARRRAATDSGND